MNIDPVRGYNLTDLHQLAGIAVHTYRCGRYTDYTTGSARPAKAIADAVYIVEEFAERYGLIGVGHQAIYALKRTRMQARQMLFIAYLFR